MFFSDVYPDNTFEIFIDLTLINKGSLLDDMDTPHETQEPHAALVDGVQTSDLKLEHEGYADLYLYINNRLMSYLYTERYLIDEL